MYFRDRRDAGAQLARRLVHYAHAPNTLVLALPRGGVPVGFEVARALGLPLDVLLVRKLGVPGQEELAMGAVASGGTRVLNEGVVQHLQIPRALVEQIAADEQRELERREQVYRGDRPPADVQGRTIILVDDGLATGSSMRAAVGALRQRGAARLVVAVPVAAPQVCDEFARTVADEMFCAETPEPFFAVGVWYDDFSPTSDAEVRHLLELATDVIQQS